MPLLARQETSLFPLYPLRHFERYEKSAVSSEERNVVFPLRWGSFWLALNMKLYTWNLHCNKISPHFVRRNDSSFLHRSAKTFPVPFKKTFLTSTSSCNSTPILSFRPPFLSFRAKWEILSSQTTTCHFERSEKSCSLQCRADLVAGM